MKQFSLRFLFVLVLFAPFASRAHATVDWIPSWCTIESWCLQKATECFIGQVTEPQGLYQANSQYSVARKAVVLCHEGYNSVVRRTIVGPVEAVPFTGEVEVTEPAARSSALQLCQSYRQDWVSAAPACN